MSLLVPQSINEVSGTVRQARVTWAWRAQRAAARLIASYPAPVRPLADPRTARAWSTQPAASRTPRAEAHSTNQCTP
uniref:hypothetical protein n=1 Tax=Nocardia gipuzkoensis TaxID=2749991 RepID=UPI0024587532